MVHENGLLVRKVYPDVVAERVEHVVDADARLIAGVHVDEDVCEGSKRESADMFTMVSSHSCWRSMGW